MKQTAVEWLLQYLNNVKSNEFCSIEKIKELLVQAKAMEKEQIIEAYRHGFTEGTCFGATTIYKFITAEEYYTSTYGSKESETKTNYCWYCLKQIKEQTDL